MSFYAFTGAIESGLIYGLLALGIFISYRVMKTPDLTTDGSFTSGAATAAIFAYYGHPILGVIMGMLAGACAGIITALLHTKLRVPPVLAGILTMTGLYSINLRIMGNQATLSLVGKDTFFGCFSFLSAIPFGNVLAPLVIAVLILFCLIRFFSSQTGLAIRATGDNETMVRSSSINTDRTKILAFALSNAMTALCGALIVNQERYAEINMGSGAIVLGLASLILGESLIRGRKSLVRNMAAALVGAVVYKLLTALVLQINITPSDLKLISALVVVAAVSYPTVKEKIRGLAALRRAQKEGNGHA